ncbi:hypothetical protein [Polaromonas sp.]|uniref:hypothetical protein n=1 Tax=Polaromonas sp. TaxID=1869339 RepID=UPI00286B768F|nr:hypothetical protein [Polaromonas sp.]
MYQPQAANKLAELLRASLTEVLAPGDACGRQPIKVSPRTMQQLQSALRVCRFHRVAWSLESDLKINEDVRTGEIDVVLSLALLPEYKVLRKAMDLDGQTLM